MADGRRKIGETMNITSRPPHSGVFQEMMLLQQIQAAEHVLHQFCQPARLQLENPDERIGTVHQRGDQRFTVQASHLIYRHQETEISMSLLEQATLRDRLELFRYLAGPFYNCQAYNQGGGPSPSARAQLRKCFEGLLCYENKQVLHAWARHINVITPPMTHWTETGDLISYTLEGYRSACPINLFQVFADDEEPRDFSGVFWHREERVPRWNPQHIEEPQNLVEAIRALPRQAFTASEPDDAVVDAFIAEIDAMMAEEDDEAPPEGTLPKSAPTG